MIPQQGNEMADYHELAKETNKLAQTAWFNFRREGFGFLMKYFPYHLKMRIIEVKEGFDKKYGTDTSQTALAQDLNPTDVNTTESSSAYAPTISALFKEMIDALDIQFNEYSFIDLGSGKGRTLLLATSYPFKKIIGVEFCAKLHEIALNNINIYQAKTNIHAQFDPILVDAAEYQFPPGNLVIYLFNPFDEPILSAILENLKKRPQQDSGKIIIVYWHPLFDQLIQATGFKLIKQKDDKNFIYGWNIYTTCN